jgi:hypothetical protein
VFASLEKIALVGFPVKTGINSPIGSNRKDFLTPTSLVFRLTEQSHRAPSDLFSK